MKGLKKISAWEHFCDYSGNTTVHGVKYVAEGRTRIERIIWIIILIIFAIICGFLIYQIVQKWEQSPVVMGVDKDTTPIYRIPFPAVTICPETKMRKSHFDHERVHESLRIMSYEEFDSLNIFDLLNTTAELEYYLAMANVCEPEKIEMIPEKFWINITTSNKSVIDIIQHVSI